MTIDILPQKDKSVLTTPLMEVIMEDQGHQLQTEERLPLMDCTNQKLPLSPEAENKGMKGTKGHWKRQDRLQGQNTGGKALNIIDNQGGG